MDLADKISELMDEQGITKYRLSKETGVSYTGLTKILSGQTKHPQIDSLQAIANFFSKPLDYFTNEDTEDEQQAPEWATAKDRRDFKKLLEEDEPIMFDGLPVSNDDKEKLKRVMEAMFWDAKEKNKKTYGRKKSED
ncbi:helix-turn-helix domain-containing protein [Paenibacillus sp. PDC88]|uniref:helix-turn-helix domain-containing protein n=1 Tax=Paenibacillus sp. PDC88 TaxID=1884375 RepID=UPI000898347E|nr:helix-turn-helix domain-containing protein [Paenibacillus sp. PDC88]SDW31507.1 Transcriptional regulator, contains XRE-family HTH domain [Paenibacillus sp. PDC88]